ncbi:hexokinase-2-like isoform X1 [Octopus vulgaris]|uniref:Hexokinase-2-like isoform X1 n=2 Tax=Octopus TaxID=6643 RepID=A0AA36FMA2_OCTVU|nr:hexokinase-2 [Octopus sinensis]CAI9739073.1 hexokinase-2-like isoform X1 [Octopus vulgaris]
MPSTPEQIARYEKIESLVKGFKLPSATYHQVMALWKEEMKNGLGKTTHATADIKMFPSYVRALPEGSERGKFLALDLGGTNFRVLYIDLNGPLADIVSKTYLIPQQVMLGTGEQLFGHVANCVANFIHFTGLEKERSLCLGFTFSFPLVQDGLASARLSKWTKGFRCEGVIGQDVCQLLQQALVKATPVKIDVVAVINDAVGTLMSAAHTDRKCEIGLILGTGCNACYMEKLENVETVSLDDDEPQQVIINTEWGAFGDNGCLDIVRTEYDRELDTYSINPGKQLVEKMIGGMYLGEIVRLTLERLSSEKLIFRGIDHDCDLFNRGKFYTKYLSEIERDNGEFFENTKQILEELGVETYTLEDCKIVKYVCALISARAAFLASAGISTLINSLKRPEVTVAIDGSLYRFHPRFHNLMSLKIQELVDPSYKFKLVLSHDGSGKGAAIVAAVTTHRKTNIHDKKVSPQVGGNCIPIAVQT